MQNRVSFSNVSVGNMNKYITPNNNGGYSATGVTKNSTSNNIESIDLSSSNINSPTITISNSNSPRTKMPTVSAFSITSHSDRDNVNINQLRCIIRDAKNEFKDYQKDDFDVYSKNILMKKYKCSEEEAEALTSDLKNIMLKSSGFSDIVTLFSNEKNSRYVNNQGIIDYLKTSKRNGNYKDISRLMSDEDIIELLVGYKSEHLDYLELYYDYLEGKTLSDAMNEQNYTKYLYEKLGLDSIATYDTNYEYRKERYETIKELFDSSLDYRDYDISREMKQSTIAEIVDENGYDAMVLELTNGNFAIVNSCTNEKEKEDLAAIIGNIADLACTDNFAKNLFGTFSNAFFDIKTSNTTKYSDEQITVCENTIKKYIDEGKDMELYGYSLGGGIMEAAYARILVEGDPKYTNKIKSVCVYNPFTLIAEQDSEEGIKKLSKDTKFLRYCAEGDVVSTFNNYVEQLDNNTVYLKAAPINSSDWFEQRGDVCNPAELFTKGNHSFSAANGYKNSSFDEYGNVTRGNEGAYVSIANVIHSFVMDKNKLKSIKNYKSYNVFYDYDEKYNSMDLKENIRIGLPYYGKIMLDSTGFSKKIPSDFEPMVKEILKNFGNEFGNINYSTFSDTFGKYLGDYVYSQTENVEITDGKEDFINVAGEVIGATIGGIIGGPGGLAIGGFLGGMAGCGVNSITADTIINETEFKNAIRESINNNENLIFTLTNSIISEDREGTDNCVNLLVDDIIDSYSDSLDDSEFIKNNNVVISKLKSSLKSKIKGEINFSSDSKEESVENKVNTYSPEYQDLIESIDNGTYDGRGLINPDYTSNTTTTTTTTATTKD